MIAPKIDRDTLALQVAEMLPFVFHAGHEYLLAEKAAPIDVIAKDIGVQTRRILTTVIADLTEAGLDVRLVRDFDGRWAVFYPYLTRSEVEQTKQKIRELREWTEAEAEV